MLSIPEISTVIRKTGRAELDEHALGIHVSEMEAPFEIRGRHRDEVTAELRERLEEIPGINLEIGQPISHRIDMMLSGTKANIAIKIFGNDLNKLFSLGNQVKAAIQDVPGVADLNVEQQVERPELLIRPKRELLARYGLTIPEFKEYLNVMLAGQVVSQVFEDGRTFDLTVKVQEEHRRDFTALKDLSLDAGGGKFPWGR